MKSGRSENKIKETKVYLKEIRNDIEIKVFFDLSKKLSFCFFCCCWFGDYWMKCKVIIRLTI